MQEITLHAGSCLVAFLGGLGQQLHNNGRNGCWDIPSPLSGRHRLSGNMAMYPFHRIGRGEGKTPGQHLVERNAQRVKVASGIYGTNHSSRLLGCHIREGPGDKLWSFSSLALVWKPRSEAKAPEPALPCDGVNENIAGL